MEKIPKYIFLILALAGYLTIQAQEVSTQPVNSTDPRLSAEQGGPGPALSNNPAKPVTPLTDPKITSEHTGSTISKPPADQLKDPKLEAEVASSPQTEVIPVINTEQKMAGTTVEDNNVQPAGIVPDSNINYRGIKGPDAQPATAKPEKVADIRNQNGPNTQPASDQPKR
jgi:hypothetical protein